MQEVELLVGDVRDVLPALPADHFHTVITSPPYFGLRAYGGQEGVIGNEETLDEYLYALVDVFNLVRRTLRPDGTVWVNIGDRYAGSWGTQGNPDSRYPNTTRQGSLKRTGDLKPKDLVQLGSRIGSALQRDGWYLRSKVIWHKPNARIENVADRPSCVHEEVLLLSRQRRPVAWNPETKLRSVVKVNARGVSGHPAAFPVELAARLMDASTTGGACSSCGLMNLNRRHGAKSSCGCQDDFDVPCRVLDPFSGSGTVAIAGGFGHPPRNVTLVEIDHGYASAARERIKDALGMFVNVSMESVPRPESPSTEIRSPAGDG